jgi:hypothetical protein
VTTTASLSPVVKHHGLARRYLLPLGFLMRPLRELLREADRYLVDLTAEVGEPSTRQRARAAAIVQRVVARRPRKTG